MSGDVRIDTARGGRRSGSSPRPTIDDPPTGPSDQTEADASGNGGYLVDPDVQRMLRVRGGDDDAFEELVAAYQGRVVGLLTHMMGQKSNVEDLAQDVFLRVYRARKGYEPTARFSTWLFRITQNVVFNSRRSESRRKEVAFRGDASGSQPGLAAGGVAERSALQPIRRAASGEVQDVVQAAVAGLNERQRMALLLHRFEGFSYADVAESMGISISAVKSLLSRAREALRQELEPYMREGSG